MLSATRIGLSAKSPLFYRPMVRGFKTIPLPPGNIIGTVNDAYVHPKAQKTHGSLHWTAERAVAVALVPLASAPFFTGVSTVVDSTLSAFLLFHCYVGFQSCIIDYIPKRKFGSLHDYAMYLLTFGTGVAAYGVYEIEKKDEGVTNVIAKIFKA